MEDDVTYGPFESRVLRDAARRCFKAIEGTKAGEPVTVSGLDVALVAGFAYGILMRSQALREQAAKPS